MRLKKAQKEAVLTWVIAGLDTAEINSRGAVFDPPFSITRQMVDKYRKTRRADIAVIREVGEYNALTSGLALKENRVAKLQQVAALMERDLLGGFMWLEQVKGVGSGPAAEIVEYEEFNAKEIEQYRGVLDDIAREMGERKTVVERDWESEARKLGVEPIVLIGEIESTIRARFAILGHPQGNGSGVAKDTSGASRPAPERGDDDNSITP